MLIQHPAVLSEIMVSLYFFLLPQRCRIYPIVEQNHVGQFISKLDFFSCFFCFYSPHKRMNRTRVHRLFGHLHQRIQQHLKIFRNLMKFNRVDCSYTIHNFAHCLLGDSNFFCQINLLFCFSFSVQPECCLQLSYLRPAYNRPPVLAFILYALPKNINHLETNFSFAFILSMFQLQFIDHPSE